MTDLGSIRGELRYDEPMAKHCSWRTGGPARRYFQPADLEDLRQFLRTSPPDEQMLWMGLGSNLLVRDGGFPGTIISIAGVLDEHRYLDAHTMKAQAGLACAKIARINAEQGFTGTEFLAGIPGTLGGALAMNAGAFGGETWDLVTSIEMLDRDGELHQMNPSEFEVGYRHVKAPAGHWFVAANLRLIKDPEGGGRERIKALLAQRQESQPMGEPSCGSVFRNPPEDHAARLIEACGLKGYSIGGAAISEKHANFIINKDNASAAHIESLIQHVQETVMRQFDVPLLTEVRIVGATVESRH